MSTHISNKTKATSQSENVLHETQINYKNHARLGQNLPSTVKTDSKSVDRNLRVSHWTALYPYSATSHNGHAVKNLIAWLKGSYPNDAHNVLFFVPYLTRQFGFLGGKYRERAKMLAGLPWHDGLEYRYRFAPPGEFGEAITSPIWQRWAGYRLAKTLVCDIIHVHYTKTLSIAAMVAARRMGIPYVLTVRQERYTFEKVPRHFRHAIVESIRSAAAVVTLSAHMQETVEEFTGVRSVIIPNGTSPLFDQIPPEENERKLKILFVGGLLKNKAVHLIIQAVKDLTPDNPDLQLTIIGAGPEKTRLWECAQGCSNIDFIGPQNPETVRAHMREASILCLPSYSESFGVVCGEAMKQGVAVIIRNGCSIDGMGQSGKDYETFANDSEFYQKLKRLVESPERLQQVASAGQKLASPWTWAANIQRHRELYDSLL